LNTRRLLVASDNVTDADLVRGLLREEFESVEVSCVEAAATKDFERARPAVVLLAFESLQRAERYCLTLYRSSEVMRTSNHRMVVLCTRDELREAYKLCRSGNFDDYVLFWPMNHDAPRLLMAVHQALRPAGGPDTRAVTANDLAAEARPLASIEQAVAAFTSAGDEAMAQAGQCVEEVETDFKAALRQLASVTSADVDTGVSRGHEPIRARLERLHSETIAPRMKEVTRHITAARRALDTGRAGMASQLAAGRKLQALVGLVRPSVVVVDDDEILCKLVTVALADVQIESRCSTSAREALRMLRESRPDLILMDIDLPDSDGIELTRLVRTLPGYAKVPIVMVTGRGDKDAVMNSMGAGAAGFLVKPLTREKLYAQVNAVLGWHAAQLRTTDSSS
jgi:CheY-like chemotaxis protein